MKLTDFEKQLIESHYLLPLGTPTEVKGQWYYRTRHAIWVLRSSDGPGPEEKHPVWVRYLRLPEEIKNKTTPI